MARVRTRRADRRAGIISPVAEVFRPDEQINLERLRAGAFMRWQDAHRGTAIAGGVKVAGLNELGDTHGGDRRMYDVAFAPRAADLKAPRPDGVFGRTIRKCEPAGPLRTSTAFADLRNN